MKLATFTQANRTRLGAVVGDEIVDFEAAAPDLPGDMISLLAAGESALEIARSAAGSGLGLLPLADVKLEAPIPRPPEFLAIGLNYADHIEEAGLGTYVNGELRQQSNTKHLVFDCFEQIEVLSTVMTLLPGTVISTGTPSGVGAAMKPRQFLAAGDVVRIEVGGLGEIENRVIDEPDDTPRI